MNNKTWLVADWHLGENRMDLMGRPFEDSLDQFYKLERNHNLLVMPEDRVIMVGDVCYQKADDLNYWLSKVSLFNGRKTLIRGNHDKVLTDADFSPYFEKIVPEGAGIYEEFGGIKCYITHYPTQGVSDAFNLVGHIHAAWKYQLNMLNIGIDANHFRPVDSDKVAFHYNAICNFYDEDVWVAYNNININPLTIGRGKKGSYFNPEAPSWRAKLFSP